MKVKLGQLGKGVGILAVVLSLIFVGYELRLNRRIAGNESFGVSTETMNEFTGLLAEHASVLAKGCMGAELSIEEDIVFSQLVWNIDRFYFFRSNRSQFGFADTSREQWAQMVARNRHIFKGFNRKWLALMEFRGTNLNPDGSWAALVEYFYAEMSTETVGTIDPSMCGL